MPAILSRPRASQRSPSPPPPRPSGRAKFLIAALRKRREEAAATDEPAPSVSTVPVQRPANSYDTCDCSRSALHAPFTTTITESVRPTSSFGTASTQFIGPANEAVPTKSWTEQRVAFNIPIASPQWTPIILQKQVLQQLVQRPLRAQPAPTPKQSPSAPLDKLPLTTVVFRQQTARPPPLSCSTVAVLVFLAYILFLISGLAFSFFRFLNNLHLRVERAAVARSTDNLSRQHPHDETD